MNRRRNQISDFRSQSFSQLVKLEILVLREFEKDQRKSIFNPCIAKINLLLDDIKIIRSDRAFKKIL